MFYEIQLHHSLHVLLAFSLKTQEGEVKESENESFLTFIQVQKELHFSVASEAFPQRCG